MSIVDLDAIQSELSQKKDLNVYLGDDENRIGKIEGFISTGSISSDIHLGGGFALGRMHEIWGDQGAGKTTLAMHVVRECQKMGGVVFWAATEASSWSPERCREMRGDPSKVIVAYPEYLEALFSWSWSIVKDIYPAIQKQQANTPILAVVDSVNASPPKSLVESGNVYAEGMAKRQRMIGDYCKMIEIPIAKTNVCMLFLNQISANIGGGYGSPAVKSAGSGNQLYHHVSTSLYLSFKGRGDSGQQIKHNLKKLKTERPYTKWEVFMWYYFGFVEMHEVYELARKYNVLSAAQYMQDTAHEEVSKKLKSRWQNKYAGYQIYYSDKPQLYQNLKERCKICVTRVVRHRDEELMEELDQKYVELEHQSRWLVDPDGFPLPDWCPEPEEIDEEQE